MEENPVKVGDIYEWYDAEENGWLYYMIIKRYNDGIEKVDHMLLNSGHVCIGDYYETFADMNCLKLVA